MYLKCKTNLFVYGVGWKVQYLVDGGKRVKTLNFKHTPYLYADIMPSIHLLQDGINLTCILFNHIYIINDWLFFTNIWCHNLKPQSHGNTFAVLALHLCISNLSIRYTGIHTRAQTTVLLHFTPARNSCTSFDQCGHIYWSSRSFQNKVVDNDLPLITLQNKFNLDLYFLQISHGSRF